MKQIILIIILFATVIANGQVPYSQSLENGIVIDTAAYKVTYRLQYKHHPTDKDYMEDTRILVVGRNFNKDYSDILCHFDSLRTTEGRRGANTYTNASGNPWPLEIATNTRNKSADVKYRLPILSGTLHYQDSIPALDWRFSNDVSDIVLGYECQKATSDFAGRTYTAWFTTELPLPFGPYKFGGLPGLILKIQDNEQQFCWEALGFERAMLPIMMYEYENEKLCSSSDAAKTIARYFKSPYSFLSAGMGGARIMVRGSDGKFRNSKEVDEQSIPYKPLEIK